MFLDHVSVDVIVDHVPARLWPILGDPESYPRFFAGISDCERVAGRTTYLLRFEPAAGTVVEWEVRALMSRNADKLVLTRVSDATSWVSVQLSPLGGGRCTISVLLFNPRYSLAGEDRSTGRVGDRRIRAWVRAGIRRICAHLAREPGRQLADGSNRVSRTLRVARIAGASGLVRPGSPARMTRQLWALVRWRATLVGGYVAAAARDPAAIALASAGERRTYGELDHRTDRIAAGLFELGVRADDTVGVLAGNSVGMVESVLACGKLGATTVVVNTTLAEPQLAAAVSGLGVTTLIRDDALTPMARYLPDGIRQFSSTTEAGSPGAVSIGELAAREPRGRLPLAGRAGQLILAPPGRGDISKGARSPTVGALSGVAGLLSRIPLHVGARMLIAAPAFHPCGMAALRLGAALRATMVLRLRFEPEGCLRTAAEHRCGVLVALPAMLRRILDLPPAVREQYDLSDLRIVASGGAALSAAFVEEFRNTFGDILYSLYGSTAASCATVADPVDLRAAPTTAGRPVLGTRVHVVDHHGNAVPYGDTGRIVIGNGMTGDGDTGGRSQQIRESLVATGDIGYIDANGRLFVAGNERSSHHVT
ncbi:AMP-binding protein [Haloechinothrix sp. LS1_15]|uniref:AMP-binding protein n=1 Tax=Haloechinothrix sp. LS1_15 TaxID=2652248 RepID=UPI00294AF74E|nr:AMP-binding protein [Haloechinothrix sp. LS1_15]